MNISLVIAVKLSHGRHIVALHYTKTVFEGLLKYMISGLYIKYRSHLTSSYVCHVVIAHHRKFKSTRFGVSSIGIKLIPSFVKVGSVVSKVEWDTQTCDMVIS
jgi:hypothetical protein